MVLCVGKHRSAKRRRDPSVLLAVLFAPAAVFFATGGDVHPQAQPRDTAPPAADPMPCCLELVAAGPTVRASAPAAPGSAPERFVSVSRWRVVDIPRALPKGVAPEQGLQVKTILAARSISAIFPEIHQIGGVRPDALRWHPDGLALDVMIPNPGSAQGIALGNQIVAFVLKNATRFAIQDAIWRGVYYTPAGAQFTGAGHYDHVHVTTFGGGYPSGGEAYFR